jgi:hypothetical protein
MEEIIQYDQIKIKLCNLIIDLRSFEDKSPMDRKRLIKELITIFDDINDDVDKYKSEMLNYIPHSMFEENRSQVNDPIFLSSPFQLH